MWLIKTTRLLCATKVKARDWELYSILTVTPVNTLILE